MPEPELLWLGVMGVLLLISTRMCRNNRAIRA
jgi:hypothetical protein